jgi:DNA primase
MRYLYLGGARRSGLPPYGLSWVLKETPRPHDLVLVEGLLDVHHLRARGVTNLAALGGTGTRAELFERLTQFGFENVTLCLDGDAAGREATEKAVEQATRAKRSPAIFVIDPVRLGHVKDPDALVRERGIEAWGELLTNRVCAVTWRALAFTRGVGVTSAPHDRRSALARAGAWLGSLPPRLALEQEDAVRAVALRCGYSEPAVERAFRARFWGELAPDGHGALSEPPRMPMVLER